MGALDFVILAGICFLFALTLAARTWVKTNEPRLIATRRDMAAAQARLRVAAMEGAAAGPADRESVERESEAAIAERR
jgi:hypothetical protein